MENNEQKQEVARLTPSTSEKQDCECTGPWDCQCPDVLKEYYSGPRQEVKETGGKTLQEAAIKSVEFYEFKIEQMEIRARQHAAIKLQMQEEIDRLHARTDSLKEELASRTEELTEALEEIKQTNVEAHDYARKLQQQLDESLSRTEGLQKENQQLREALEKAATAQSQ